MSSARGVLISVVSLTVVGAIVCVALFVSADGTDEQQRAAVLVASVLSFIAPTVAALLAFLRSEQNAVRLDNVQATLNDGIAKEQTVKTVNEKLDAAKQKLESLPVATQATAERIESKVSNG